MQQRNRFGLFLLLSVVLVVGRPAVAEEYRDDDAYYNGAPQQNSRPKQKRKYMVADPDRVDAGLFHVGFAVGGNFYIEPKFSSTTNEPLGDYFKDFGFQGGMYFDYDYSALSENVPIAVRGMLGYKRILGNTNVFAVDGVVRHMFRFSDKATFGIGPGVSAALWFREASTTAPVADEEIIFLPSFIITAGFEYNPFMVDFKWLINRVGQDATIMGFELSFGFRL